MKKIFAFDMGKASIGYCCREADNIMSAGSVIIAPEHSSFDDIRKSRRTRKTLEAHKEREKFFNELWQEVGLEKLNTDDKKFKIEFASKSDDTIYNSILLRIALLQNKKLENWQIYKALHNAFQRRGYDTNIPWKNAKSKDDEENEAQVKIYTQKDGVELIQNEQYKYPCYYDALLLGLWEEKEPQELKRCINNPTKVRTAGRVAPRTMVIKELSDLWLSAQKQIPELRSISVERFLYGEYREPYASYTNSKLRKFMGTNEDWQGVLGQKIPRFNNRVISKCRLLPKRNVCSADTIENITFVLLQQLHNFRYVNSNGETNCRLAPYEMKEIYENKISEWEANLEDIKKNNKNHSFTITKSDIEKVIGKGEIQDKILPFKANISGRSSFCRRAMQIMIELYLTGTEPMELNVSKFIDKTNANPITEDEIKKMLAKVGSWNELHISDNREETAALAKNSDIQTDLMIGNITNPIVRNRLQIFKNLLLDMVEKHGKPDEVIFEFVRDGKDNSLFGAIKAQANENFMKNNEKKNDEIKKKLEDINAFSSTNFLKYKLAEMQDWKCIYSGRKIALSDFVSCEIDHIFPRTDDGNDALYNKVICYREYNSTQNKGGRTPYEWLHSDTAKWQEYVTRIQGLSKKLGKTKVGLLTLPPNEAEKLLERKNGLAETAQIARVAQAMTAFILGWGLQVKDENRHIFVNNGSSTSKIRRQYNLNRLLGDDEKKNRQNDKHHALDAICISYSRDFVYDTHSHKYKVNNIDVPQIEKIINDIIPYPYTNDKPLKSATAPEETIYGKKEKNGKIYITKRVSIDNIKQEAKSINKISDEEIQSDLLAKLEDKMSAENWENMLKTYIHPTRKTQVKKVLILEEGKISYDANGRERIGEYCDFGTKGTKGQFKKSKQHKGQILYFDEKGKVKVMPLYSNKKTQDVKNELINMGCKLYRNGEMFYSGCLVEIPNNFEAQKIKRNSGIYKLRTIQSNGGIKLEDINGNEFIVMAQIVVMAHIKKYKKYKSSK